MTSTRRPVLAGLLSLALAGALSFVGAPAHAAEPASAGPVAAQAGAVTTAVVDVFAPPGGAAGGTVPVTVTLTDTSQTPIPDGVVHLQRRDGTTWAPAGDGTTDQAGHATVAAALPVAGDNDFRVVYDGDTGHTAATSFTVGVTAVTGPSALTLTAPAAGQEGGSVPVTVTLTGGNIPLAGGQITVEESTADGWVPAGTVVTDGNGQGRFTVPLPAGGAVFRAVWDGTGQVTAAQSDPVTVTAGPAVTVVTLTGVGRLVDGRSGLLHVSWRTAAGQPVPGRLLLLHNSGRGWVRGRRVRTGRRGTATIRVRPRVDTAYRVRGLPGAGWQAAASRVHRVDNVPPGRPVVLPRSAPGPVVHLPPQPRAVGYGAHPVLTRIPNRVWASMVGRSWHRGCPVGRAGLRLLRVNYWGFDGYRHRGELVVAAAVVGKFRRAFTSLYWHRYPIRSMYLVDRFGYSARSRGANDYASMRADNTSAFNCRDVTGRRGVLSPHATGRAVDINTWENPYWSQQGLFPDRWWQFHADPRVTARYRSSQLVRQMTRAGFRWTYGLVDTQHFDG